jgi:peptidoglycan/xylan/chitin deacetylase (PgdA/CDA1 family)
MPMAGLREQIIRAGFEALYFSGAHTLLRHFVGGVGAILTLHHVRPARVDEFQPNGILEITPEFLEHLIVALRASDIDFVSLDEAHRRLTERDFRRRFAAITLDDGYRDNKEFAWPIFKTHDVPFAIYIPTSFIDRDGELWWLALEEIIAGRNSVSLRMDGEDRTFSCVSTEEKYATFSSIYWWLRSLRTETEVRGEIRALASRHEVDIKSFCEKLCMNWSELAELTRDPLMTAGAHTINHFMLAKIDTDTAKREMEQGRARIEQHLGVRPVHFSYPFGDPTSAGPREFAATRELGFRTAVTTRPGVLFPEHSDHLMALPRISINGDYQRLRYVDVLMSGAATAMWNGFRRVNAA